MYTAVNRHGETQKSCGTAALEEVGEMDTVFLRPLYQEKSPMNCCSPDDFYSKTAWLGKI